MERMGTRIAIAAAVSLIAFDAGAAPQASVLIVSRAGDDEAATDRPKRALAADGVTLYAVLRVRDGNTVTTYSDAPAIQIGGKRIAARPLRDAPDDISFLWFKVEPATENMSNEASGRFRFEPIEYVETAVAEWLGKGTVAADVRPTATPDRGGGLGTMRYRLMAITPWGMVATPGTRSRRGRGSGGLTDAVHRVSLRKDDSYLGYLTELYGQPYIWASAGTTDAGHQSERLEGADCADFVVYGRRRMGKRIAYTWSGGLPEYTKLVARGTPDPDGRYVTERGDPVKFSAPGDIVLFPRHVGVLVEDRGTIGVLDHADVMVHTLFESPHEQAIGDTSYAGTWAEVRRWK